MAYQTGTAASMAALLSTIQTFATSNGFSATGNILYTTNSWTTVTTAVNTGFSSITLRGSYDTSGTLNQSPTNLYFTIPDGNWPITYHLFGYGSPTNLFCIAEWGAGITSWLAFGEYRKSSSLITGNAFCAAHKGSLLNATQYYRLTSTTGGDSSPVGSSGAFCWFDGAAFCTFVAHNIEGRKWSGITDAFTVGYLKGIAGLYPFWERGVNTWNNQSILLPIRIMTEAKAAYTMDLGDIPNVRYIRVDNYNNGDTITLGADTWKIFAFIKKNLTNPTFSYGGDHTCGFGWAFKI